MKGRWLALALVAAGPAAADPPPASAPPSSPAAEARAVAVPQGANVLVNGSFAPGEWADATTVPLDAAHELLVKQDARYLYLGIRCPLTG